MIGIPACSRRDDFRIVLDRGGNHDQIRARCMVGVLVTALNGDPTVRKLFGLRIGSGVGPRDYVSLFVQHRG